MINNKINILLVDDRPEGLITLEAVLTDPEYNLVKANSGNEALAHVLAYDFAVILMDVQMPEMDGFETATVIKQREKSKNIPIIFMTAINKDDHYITRGYSVGAVDYMFKPLDAHVLKSKVAIFVDLYKKNKLLQEQGEALRDSEKRDRLRMITELELEGRRRYQNLADAIPQIVFRVGRDGHIEYFNQYSCQYIGASLKDSLNDSWKKAVHPKDLQDIRRKWLLARRTLVGFEMESRFRRGETGEYRWHLFRIVPDFNNISELQSWIGFATDIHDQKMIHQELLTAKKMAEVANETKSRFLANMSHEIRTPLGVILGFSELLMDPKIEPAEKNQALSAIRRNGDLLSKIIDEILDISKVEAGKLDLEMTEVPVVDLLKDVKSFMGLQAKEKQLDLELEIQGEIPTKIISNSTRLQQIFVNVIGNAIKFSPKGLVKVDVSFQAQKSEDSAYLCVNVRDSGPGLTSQQIDNLFQPFTQVDTSMTRKHGGTGLGLALSKKLAIALGGDITVQPSRPGEGCNFLIKVKTGHVENVAFTSSLDSKNASSVKENANYANLEGIHVLLVEDSPDNQILVSRFLTMAGARVDLANNGREGVNKALAGDYDVVLMDIQMPELDGFGALKELKNQGYKRPIVALTAHGMIEEREHCLHVGFDDHLTKPVNRFTLIEQVRHFAYLKKNNVILQKLQTLPQKTLMH